MSTSTTNNGGIGFLGLLTIVFVTLKLTSVIAWSWWWVLAPMWLPITVLFGVVIVFGLIGAALNK